MKLNREEGAHLQKENEALRIQTEALRGELKQLKGAISSEVRNRKRLIAETENAHLADVSNERKQFAIAKTNLLDSRDQAAAQQLTGARTTTTSIKYICTKIQESMSTFISDIAQQTLSAKQNVRQACADDPDTELAQFRRLASHLQETHSLIPGAEFLSRLPPKNPCTISESISFEVPGPVCTNDRAIVPHYIPSHLVHTMNWIRQCLH